MTTATTQPAQRDHVADYTQIHAYLFFSGNCEAALEFYKKTLGAKVNTLMRFSESPDPLPEEFRTPGYENKVMHADMTIGKSMVMASDGCGPGDAFKGFSLSFATPCPDEATRVFNALAEGGNITMPLGKTFWSPLFGMVTDRFGVNWMVNTLPCEEK